MRNEEAMRMRRLLFIVFSLDDKTYIGILILGSNFKLPVYYIIL
jgi:hypothetical protein